MGQSTSSLKPTTAPVSSEPTEIMVNSDHLKTYPEGWSHLS